MQYRITYIQDGAREAETIIVSGLRAVHALIDYANKWGDTILSVEDRARYARTWKLTTITQDT